MVDTRDVLAARLQAAFDVVEPGADPVLRASDRADFQANGALALAKRLGRPPADVAAAVLAGAQLDDVCERVEISGPGFINLTLSDAFVSRQFAALAADAALGVEPSARPQTVVVDYSAPNVAKEMHVGHLRSTIIGDALCRMLGSLGHTVVRENHIGDWGTPFGMLIEHLLDLGEAAAVHELSVGDLDGFYRAARVSFDSDPAFAERSRRRVVALQGGDPETLRLWKVLVGQSVRYFDEVYRTLGVLLTTDDVVGESFYNPMLPSVVDELDALGLLVIDDGARCVFPPGFSGRDGTPQPLIVQKADGGFGYAATDLAAIRDRVQRIGADRLLYVVGAPQAQHFAMVFAVAAMAGWLPDPSAATHVAFGNVLGADGKMFKTRRGDTIKLIALLDEAVERAEAAQAERLPDQDPAERAAVGRMVGLGAVKYADLSTERIRDYTFDWDRMLAFEGDTAAYVQYAHARIRSIFRTGEISPAEVAAGSSAHDMLIVDPHERALAMHALAFNDAVQQALDLLAPNKLTAYLHGLASAFATFYDHCPVLKAPDVDTRRRRLWLSDTTARILATGLALLGIEAPERM